MKEIIKIKYVLPALILFVSGVFYMLSMKNDTVQEGISHETESIKHSNLEDEGSSIFVYICGHVMVPGVYELSHGSRLCDGIEKAGGITPEGNLINVNLAEVLVDGQKVVIGSEADAEVETDDGKINLNKATETELMNLPGIGEVKAKSIITYREGKGDFKSIEDIMLVEGIKESLFTRIKDYIKI